MTRSLQVSLLPPVVFLSLVCCACTPSNLSRLTDNAYDDGSPQINASGMVVWEGCDSGSSTCSGGDYEIFLWNGTQVTKITDNDYMDRSPQINDNGWLVWEADPDSDDAYDIFLYVGTDTIRLTDNTYNDLIPQLNNNGWVTWTACDGPSCIGQDGVYQIFLYDGLRTIQLTDNAYDCCSATRHGPRMNNRGEVVWVGHDDPAPEIFLYDGANTVQLTDNDYADYSPEINDNGQIVWEAEGIWLYDGVNAKEISGTGSGARISGNDEVVWYGLAGNDYEVFLYDGTNTTQLTNNDYDDMFPHVNASGKVVWRGAITLYEDDWRALYLHKIISYDVTATTELADYLAYGWAGSFPSNAPKTSEDGTVVWGGFGPIPDVDWEIFLAVP